MASCVAKKMFSVFPRSQVGVCHGCKLRREPSKHFRVGTLLPNEAVFFLCPFYICCNPGAASCTPLPRRVLVLILYLNYGESTPISVRQQNWKLCERYRTKRRLLASIKNNILKICAESRCMLISLHVTRTELKCLEDSIRLAFIYIFLHQQVWGVFWKV